ncbi:MAG TPA: GtrA family protein [Rhizomicrobium sp.]|nr:GtrA family protein [Rhizomicrobium sp.]
MIALLARFSLVGVANTVIGLGIVTILDLGFHLRPSLANAVGYLVGISFSFFLTRSLVFRSSRGAASTAWKYALAMACAFSINQLVLLGMGHLLGSSPIFRLIAQITAMASYTLVNFLLCRYWVFPESDVGR